MITDHKKKGDIAVVLFSGGQDSTTCLYWAFRYFKHVYPILFRYGQKHEIEIECARDILHGIPFPVHLIMKIVDFEFLKDIGNSALVKGGNVNEHHPDKKNLPASFVPNRNQIFLTIAHAYAQSLGADHIVTGTCQTDFSGYPDCRDDFIKALQAVTNLGSDSNIIIHTPLMWLTKGETFLLAKELGCLKQILERSHTCYNGDHSTQHQWGYGCGECPACELRRNGWEEYLTIEGD